MDRGLRVGAGVEHLDRLLGGFSAGDNVVWRDDAGTLAMPFCLNFLRADQAQTNPLVYVSFDFTLDGLLEKLGPLAQNPLLTVVDCVAGAGPSCQRDGDRPGCRIMPVENADQVERVLESLFALPDQRCAGARVVFESLGGMRELWGSDEAIIQFFNLCRPRLAELGSTAYWLMGKQGHSSRLREQINQEAQVVVDLGLKRGNTFLSIVKADNLDQRALNQHHNYLAKDTGISFDDQQRANGLSYLGHRLRELRTRKGLSQTELARLVGVTPSTISQVESNLILPSLPALVKMAEVLSVEVSHFFSERRIEENQVIFAAAQASSEDVGAASSGAAQPLPLLPPGFRAKAEPFIVEVQPKESLPSHFFSHKGEELGYVLSGRLQLRVNKAMYTARSGDVVYLTSETPTQWTNPGRTTARLLWIKIN